MCGGGFRLRRIRSGSLGEVNDGWGFQWLAVEQWRCGLGQERGWWSDLRFGYACGRKDGFWSVWRLVFGGVFSLRFSDFNRLPSSHAYV